MPNYTTNLNLFKYDVINDAKSSFSITNALNNNWDVIDNICNPTKLDIITSNSSTITLQKDKVIYKYTPSGTTTFSFSATNLGLTSNTEAYTFELLVPMTTVYTLSFSNVSWQNSETPDMSNTGTYWFAFRTTNAGSSWIGNLQGRWT